MPKAVRGRNQAMTINSAENNRPVRVKFLRAAQRGTGVPPVNPYGQDARATSKNHIPQGGIFPVQVENNFVLKIVFFVISVSALAANLFI